MQNAIEAVLMASMRFDFEQIAPTERFNFLTSTVVPRPIALVTSLDPDGNLNAAPYSFFGLISHDPPLIALGILPHPDAQMKDTGRNIQSTGEFVVNLVSETLAEAMNVTCIDAPPGVSEMQLAKLDTIASDKINPPRVASSPVAFECVVHTSLSFGPDQVMVLGRIVQAHVDQGCVLDAEACSIHTPALNLIGGMHGARWYCRTADLFAMDRPTWATWKQPE